MIPGADIPPEHREWLTENGCEEWDRLVSTLGHHALDVDEELVAYYGDSLSFVLSLAHLLQLRGGVEIKHGRPVEAPVVQMLADALESLRGTIAEMGIEQPLPEMVSVERLTRNIRAN